MRLVGPPVSLQFIGVIGILDLLHIIRHKLVFLYQLSRVSLFRRKQTDGIFVGLIIPRHRRPENLTGDVSAQNFLEHRLFFQPHLAQLQDALHFLRRRIALALVHGRVMRNGFHFQSFLSRRIKFVDVGDDHRANQFFRKTDGAQVGHVLLVIGRFDGGPLEGRWRGSGRRRAARKAFGRRAAFGWRLDLG